MHKQSTRQFSNRASTDEEKIRLCGADKPAILTIISVSLGTSEISVVKQRPADAIDWIIDRSSRNSATHFYSDRGLFFPANRRKRMNK
ncbi:hypothetical protein AAFN90_05875 [Erwiniaceae bacterium CAU 1747]